MKTFKINIIIYASMLLLSLILSMLLIKLNPAVAFGLIFALSAIYIMFRYPDIGTFFVIFIVYTNIPVIAKQVYGAPQLLASSIMLLLAIPITHYIFFKKEQFIIDNVLIIMVLFLLSLIASSFVSKDIDVAKDWIIVYIQEGLILYFLVVNVIRSIPTLKRVIWALLLAGSLLGGVSLYQELTQSYDNQFGGLSRKGIEKIERWEASKDAYAYERTGIVATRDKVRGVNRAEGPIDEPNRYAQLMIVLIPLGFFGFRKERSTWLRRGAVVAPALILSRVFLLYS